MPKSLADVTMRTLLLSRSAMYMLPTESTTTSLGRFSVAEVAWPPDERALVYVCGPTGFVEAAAEALVALGHEPGRIRTVGFGPSGAGVR